MRVGWILMVLALCLPRVGWASSADKLTRARTSYEDGDYAKSRQILEEMFRSADLSGDQLRQAHIYLAASYYYLGEVPKAQLEFDALFRQSPLARVDPVLFPPEIVQLANTELQKLEAEQDTAPARPAPTPAPAAGTTTTTTVTPPQAALANRISTPSAAGTSAASVTPRATPPSVGYSFIPFGVGQFANEQYGKGALFLSLEVVALATFTTAGALAQSLKSGGVPFISYTPFPNTPEGQTEQSEFNTYQTIYIAAFWTGVGIYAIGVAESLLSRPSQEELDARHSVASLQLGDGKSLQLVPTGLVMRF